MKAREELAAGDEHHPPQPQLQHLGVKGGLVDVPSDECIFSFFVLHIIFKCKPGSKSRGARAAIILVTLFSPFKITLYGCFVAA